MKTKFVLGALCALTLTASAFAADSSMSPDCKHPCPMMSDGKGKMEDMHKGMNMGDQKKTAQEYSSKGKIVGLKPPTGTAQKITLAHEPIPALKWPAMTMEFALASSELARGVAPGDVVSFRFVERGGSYVVTHLVKSRN